MVMESKKRAARTRLNVIEMTKRLKLSSNTQLMKERI